MEEVVMSELDIHTASASLPATVVNLPKRLCTNR